MSEATNEARGRAHVILIHGTFARGADWIQEDAPLRQYLRGALGDAAASTAIEAFNWSGRNSFKARTDAAQKLQAMIARIVAADQQARVYLVGHSHGGNIALQAAAHPEIGRSIDGIVCLATPVMHSTLVTASPDDSGRAIRLWTMIAALVPVGLIADRVALDAAAEWTQVRPAWLVGIVSVAILLVSALARFVVLRLRRHGRIESFNLRAAVKLNALLRPPRLDHARIVFVRHAGDEATLTANFLGLLGYLSDWASSILEQRYRRLDTMLGSQIGKRLAIGFVVASIALVGFFQFIHAPEIRGIVFGVLLLALAVPPLVSLILRLTRAFGTLRTLFFGVAVVPIGSFIRIGVETTPPGSWTVVMLPEPPEAAPDDVAAAAVPIVDAHCRVYRQPEFLVFVSEWIAGRVRAARAG